MTSGTAGASVTEILLVMTLMATVLGIGAPLVVHARDAEDGRHAALFLAGQMRAARQQAVLTGRSTALVFDLTAASGDATWVLRVCTDGDGDGVMRTDLASGVDACAGPAMPLSAWSARASIDREPTVPDLTGNPDGAVVSFGSSRIASFSPMGTSSSGSVTIRTRGDRHYAVRVAGVTGRVRMYRYVSESRRWQEW